MFFTSLFILAGLSEPLYFFEVEAYFQRAANELAIKEPSYDDCVLCYIYHLVERIVMNKQDPFLLVDEIYFLIRENFQSEEFSVWYDISGELDDFRYGDNKRGLTKERMIARIMNEANQMNEMNNHFK